MTGRSGQEIRVRLNGPGWLRFSVVPADFERSVAFSEVGLVRAEIDQEFRMVIIREVTDLEEFVVSFGDWGWFWRFRYPGHGQVVSASRSIRDSVGLGLLNRNTEMGTGELGTERVSQSPYGRTILDGCSDGSDKNMNENILAKGSRSPSGL